MKFLKKKQRNLLSETGLFLVLFSGLFIFLFLSIVNAADPVGPDSVGIVANETKGANPNYTLNISGGRIATINITTTTQNPRWKAFVGNVSGSFTLDDSTGSTIYDWSLTTISGEIYATRVATTIAWATINCSNITWVEAENTAMSHTNPDDNITATFNLTANATHSEFFTASQNISANSCPTLNTYVNNATQDTSFEEVILYEPTNGDTVYATILEPNVTGFDANQYDFQMIVPENGAEGFSGATAYYLYVEIT